MQIVRTLALWFICSDLLAIGIIRLSLWAHPQHKLVNELRTWPIEPEKTGLKKQHA